MEFPRHILIMTTLAVSLAASPLAANDWLVEVKGSTLKAAMEQSFTHLRGLVQVSGLEVVYDTTKPERQRLVSLRHDGKEVQDDDVFRIAMAAIIARGGDHFEEFLEGRIIAEFEPLGEQTIDYYRKHGTVAMPERGRQTDLAASQ